MSHPVVEKFAFATEGSTVDQILIASGRLFAAKGFHGTSTREISAAVGIRQPSLFHHFASKAEIAQYLFEYDRRRSHFLTGENDLPDAPPAVAIYHMLRREARSILSSRYELQGLYLTDLLQEAEFAFWRENYLAAEARFEAHLAAGSEAGEFIALDPGLVFELFDAMLTRLVRWSHVQPRKISPDDVATLLLRAILAEPARLPAIRKDADNALIAQRENAGP